MTIHLLHDVDDALLVNNAGTLVINESAIDLMVKYKITKIDFLTKMDAFHMSINSPLRLIPIQRLEKQSISVGKVYTLADLFYIEVLGIKHKMGDAYELYFKPIEEAILKIRSLENKVFQTYAAYYSILNTFQVLNFLVNKNVIQSNTLCLSCLTDKQNIIKKIDDILYDSYVFNNHQLIYENELFSIDYSHIANDIFTHLDVAVKNNNTSTISNYLEILKKQRDEQNDQLIPTCEENKQAIKDYFEKFYRYRSWYYVCHVILSKRENNLNRKNERTKGEVYLEIVNEKKIKSDDLVIFIDDNDNELASLNQAHKERGYNHALITLKPPFYKGFNTAFCISVEAFEKQLTEWLIPNKDSLFHQIHTSFQNIQLFSGDRQTRLEEWAMIICELRKVKRDPLSLASKLSDLQTFLFQPYYDFQKTKEYFKLRKQLIDSMQGGCKNQETFCTQFRIYLIWLKNQEIERDKTISHLITGYRYTHYEIIHAIARYEALQKANNHEKQLPLYMPKQNQWFKF